MKTAAATATATSGTGAGAGTGTCAGKRARSQPSISDLSLAALRSAYETSLSSNSNDSASALNGPCSSSYFQLRRDELLLFSVPEAQEDFDLLPQQEFLFQHPCFPYFKLIKRNLYRPPCYRSTGGEDDVPACSCTPLTGCTHNCQNRLVFM
jgi:hypothetical protein